MKKKNQQGENTTKVLQYLYSLLLTQTKILIQFTQLEIQLNLHGFSMIIIQFFVKIIS